jgi:hypothetical protein
LLQVAVLVERGETLVLVELMQAEVEVLAVYGLQ